MLTAVATSAVVLFPAPLPTPQNPDYLDNIFDSRAIVWIARLLLASGAVVLAATGAFAVASMVVRVRSGHWLKRAGPFEVSEVSLEQLERHSERYYDPGQDMEDELTELRVQLAITSELIENIQHERVK